MDREEKALEQTLDVLINKLNDSKTAIGTLIARLEDDGATMDPVTWNNALDSYAVISSHINQVLRNLKQDPNSLPNLRNRVVFPVFLNPERDEELIQMTEGRVQAVNHDMVPNYLRTCPEPEIEAKEQHILMRASNMSIDQGTKAVATANTIVDKMSDLVKRWKDDWESETGSGRINPLPTTRKEDTTMIISAICNGTGLRPDSKLIGPGPLAPAPAAPQAPAPGPVKATKMIRTKITANNPYNR